MQLKTRSMMFKCNYLSFVYNGPHALSLYSYRSSVFACFGLTLSPFVNETKTRLRCIPVLPSTWDLGTQELTEARNAWIREM